MSELSFQYKAVDAGGRTRAGVIDAPTMQEAYRKLSSSGMVPTTVKPARARLKKPGLPLRRAIKPEEIAHFTYQFSILLQARIPVVECFRSSAEQERNEAFRAVLLDIATRVQSGSTITESMNAHRDLFGPVYIETVRAAEQTGNMIEVLAHLAEMVEEQTEMTRLIRGAMMYPITVVVALSGAMLFLLAFVVPRFASMFESRGVDLPVLTRALQSVGLSIRGYWWLYAAVAVGTVFLVRRAWKTPHWRDRIDRALHCVPFLNRMLIALAVGRFSSIFGLSLSSGMGLIDALDMGGRATARPMLEKDVHRLIEQVGRGGRLGEVLPSCTYFPAFVRQLLTAGESSAELPRMCQIITRHYQRESKHLARNAATILEPILIAGLTGVVLVVALAIFLPMWDMVSLVQ